MSKYCSLFAILCTLLLVLSCCVHIPGCNALRAPPMFILDLDKPPGERWVGAVDLIVKEFTWEFSFGPFFNTFLPYFYNLAPGTLQRFEKLIQTRYPDLYEEIKYNAGELSKYNSKSRSTSPHYEINTTIMCGVAFFYELSHVHRSQKGGTFIDRQEDNAGLSSPLNMLSSFRKFPIATATATSKACCGILSLPEDKTLPIIQGRNLDLNPLASRNATLHIFVMRNRTFLYDSFAYGWTTGGLGTTSRPGKVTLQWNWRMHKGGYSFNEIMRIIENPKSKPAAFWERFVQEKELDFDQTVAYLTGSMFAAPFYVIMSGTERRGAVITLDPDQSKTVIELFNDSSPVSYIVQTNYDRWLPDPPSDPRRTVAEKTLQMMGREQSGSKWGVWMALSVWPVHNTETLFSALMTVNSTIEGYVRMPMTPYVEGK